MQWIHVWCWAGLGWGMPHQVQALTQEGAGHGVPTQLEVARPSPGGESAPVGAPRAAKPGKVPSGANAAGASSGQALYRAGQPAPAAKRFSLGAGERQRHDPTALSQHTRVLNLCKRILTQEISMVEFLRQQSLAMCGGEGALTISVRAHARVWALDGASTAKAETSWQGTVKPGEAQTQACLKESVQQQQAHLDKARAEHAACEAEAWAKYRQALRR